MGASFTEQTGTGRTANEAFARARQDAQDEFGHQDGYSGAINSGGYGFVLVTLPPRYTYRKLQALLEEYESTKWAITDAQENIRSYRPGGIWNGMRGWKGNLKKAEIALRKATAARERLLRNVPDDIALDIDSLSDVYTDKWGDYLAVELRGAEAKQYQRFGSTKRRGEKLYVFFGYAPS